jgi:hypothetical protein
MNSTDLYLMEAPYEEAALLQARRDRVASDKAFEYAGRVEGMARMEPDPDIADALYSLASDLEEVDTEADVDTLQRWCEAGITPVGDHIHELNDEVFLRITLACEAVI